MQAVVPDAIRITRLGNVTPKIVSMLKTRMPKQIAFIAYETPYAPCGGVAAVMAHLPANLATTSGLPTIVITPFHSNIARTNSLEHQMEWLGDCEVPYGASSIIVDILRHHRDVSYIFLHAKGEPRGRQPFFSGIQHPYDVETPQNDNGSTLQRDALFFGAAVSRALPVIDQSASWILLLQDWEAATVALALTGAQTDLSYSLLLTLHNSYDKGANDEDLRLVGINPEACPGDTVLKRALPLVQSPVFTVSDQFALDFTKEILQAKIMAPHLASQLSSRLVGINNGPFTELVVDSDILANARRGDLKPLREWKTQFREKALIILDGFTPTKDKPIWGNLRLFNSDDAPWFIMAGRDDSRQKGYDVACSAISRFLDSGGEARFMFFPIPGDEGLEGLSFLRRLSQRHSESVLVLPFIFQEGFFAFLQGATFGMMPSLYEPFGMANEFYLKGTVGIGRATGGILQQIVPSKLGKSYNKAVRVRAKRWHAASANPTGFLYREQDGIPSALEDWRSINAARYDSSGASPDRVQQREQLLLFDSMVDELRRCIADATQLWREQPELYCRMLIDGIAFIENNFSWEKAARLYLNYIG